MTTALPTYDEPLKKQSRHIVLEHAVRMLTTDRLLAPVITPDEFADTFAKIRVHLRKHCQYPSSSSQDDFDHLIEYWQAIHRLRIGVRDPKELQVLILCGPNPSNDFEKLRDLGVPPCNIWAIESNKQLFQAAVESLKTKPVPYRIHKGSLSEFFAVVPQQFDIVYFDGCGPLLGGSPSSLQVIKELFLNQRLSPLSVLITNFSVPHDSAEQIKWAERMASWYGPRSTQPKPFPNENAPEIRLGEYMSGKDGGAYVDHITQSFHDYYSDFITSFLYEFSGQLLPWWRCLALKGAREELFASKSEIELALDASLEFGTGQTLEEILESTGLAVLIPDSYRHQVSAMIANFKLDNGDVVRALYESEYKGVKLLKAASAFSLLRNFSPGDEKFGSHNRLVCNDLFREVLTNFSWLDSPGRKFARCFCDIPFQHLLVDLCAGQVGYPYHVSLQKSLRLAYTAKSTEMFMDLTVMDQMRYMYEFLPSIPLLKQPIAIPIQIVIRTCMEAIWKNSYQISSDIFSASTLFQAYDHNRLQTRNKVELE